MEKFNSLLRLSIVVLPCSLPIWSESSAQSAKAEPPGHIEDNLFFIEEAFNQKDNVIQHISNALNFPVRFYKFFNNRWVDIFRMYLSCTLTLV